MRPGHAGDHYRKGDSPLFEPVLIIEKGTVPFSGADHVPPLAKHAAALACVELGGEHAVEVDRLAARNGFETRMPVRNPGRAGHCQHFIGEADVRSMTHRALPAPRDLVRPPLWRIVRCPLV